MQQTTAQLLQFKQNIIDQYGEDYYNSMLSSSAIFKRTYQNDRVAFVHDCIKWKPGQGPKEYQLQALGALDIGHSRVAIQSLHGIGKTTTMALNSLHFALTRDGQDWKALATASAWRQLSLYYFPEVHKWARLIEWGKVGRGPLSERLELKKLSLDLSTGALTCVASDNPGYIEGAHADRLAYFFDESKLIPAATFDAVEGAFSNEGASSGAEAFAFAASTPGVPSGRFYDICRRAAGLENWHVIRVTLDMGIAAGQISPVWAENMRRLWGEKSSVYRNRVLGEFAAQDENSVIPLAWVEAANERYRELEKAGLLKPEHLPPLTAIGADVGDGGGDPTVIAPRFGDIIHDVQGWESHANEQVLTASRIGAKLNLYKNPDAQAIVDGIGVGSGVVSNLANSKYLVTSFVASQGCDIKDETGTFGFLNLRAFAWWNFRELLNPEKDSKIALPPIPELIGDLTAPTWKEAPGGKIKIESKEDIKKRNDGRSTDYGDAVVMVFAKEYLGKRRAMFW